MHERQKWKLIYSSSRPNYNNNNINDNNDNDNNLIVQKKKLKVISWEKIITVNFSCIFH